MATTKKKFSELTEKQKEMYKEGLRYDMFKKAFAEVSAIKPKITKHYTFEISDGEFAEALGDDASLSAAKTKFKKDCYDKFATKHPFTYEDVERDEDGSLKKDANGNICIIKKKLVNIDPETVVNIREDGIPSKFYEFGILSGSIEKEEKGK